MIVCSARIVYPQPFSDHFITISSLKSLRLTNVVDDKGAIDRDRTITLYRSFDFDLPLFGSVIRKKVSLKDPCPYVFTALPSLGEILQKRKRGTDRSFHRTGSGKPWRKISNSPHARIHTDARVVSHSSPLKIYQILSGRMKPTLSCKFLICLSPLG